MNKLKNENGVTILMALLLLLAATVVSVVILTAATTAARHLENDRALQQSYLTVSSAAELIRDDILSSQFQQTIKTPYTNNRPGTSTVVDADTVIPTGFMSPWLAAGKEKADKGLSYPDTAITLSVGPAGGMDDVQAVFSMDEQYNITVVLSLAEDSTDNCRLTLTLSGNASTSDPARYTDNWGNLAFTLTTSTVSWERAHIGKGTG